MNAQFQVAQISGSQSSPSSAPARIFRIAKPLTDQAVVVNLGYDQKATIDFTAVANEKITLVHVGEKLIILFDNKSTVTVEPFFDSRHDAQQNLSVEVAPGRDVSVSEFASLFPITTDQSVLPAAGDGNGNAQASGANFSTTVVDPLGVGNPLDLLGPEALGTFALGPDTFNGLPSTTTAAGVAGPPTIVAGPPTIVAGLGLPLVVDESSIPGVGAQSAIFDHFASANFAASFTIDAPAGVQSVSYALVINNQNTGLFDSLSGEPVVLVSNGNGEVDGVVTINGQQEIVFTITVDAAGHVVFTEWRAVRESDTTNFDETTNLPAGSLSLVATVTDNNGLTATADLDLGSQITIHDDGPILIPGRVVGGPVDEDGLANSNADNTRPGEVDGTDLPSVSGGPGSLNVLVNFGADGGTFGLATIDPPVDSGLTSKGEHILLVTDANGLHGYVDDGVAGFGAGDREVFTLTVGADGSYTFTLKGQIDHDPATGTPDDDRENILTIDLSTYVEAVDGDGDSIPLGAGTFTFTVLDDIPVVIARPPEETTVATTETVTYSLQAGNTDARGMDGQNDHDILLTGVDINEHDDSVNTTGSKIGIGDGQIIDGYGTHPKLTGPEILTMQFVNSLSITGNPNSQTITHSGAYDVSSATFSIDVAEAHQVHTAVVFVSATDNGNFVGLNFTVDGSAFAATSVFDNNGNQIGYVLDGVPDLSTVVVTGATGFDTLSVGNYNNFQFKDTDTGHTQTFTDGNSFKVYGIESTITTTTVVTETFKVSHDESHGVNTQADPNAANDVDPQVDQPPAAILDANAIGYAKSSTSVIASGSPLFSGSVGADADGTWSFQVTDAQGNAIDNVDSGLTTLDGTRIMLSTDGNGAVVGTADQTEVFKVYVDGDGFVWIAQYQPIANPVAGSSAAAYDDIATATADLHVKATLTDFDGDSTSVVSGVALQIQFQDDGPLAVDDVDSVFGASLTATGNVITGKDIVGGDGNTTDGNADHVGTDGAKITEVSGITTDTSADPSHNFQVTGKYGTLVINENGDYTYTRFDGSPIVDVDVFTYTLTDGDGDFSTAKLTISISDRGVTISGIGSTDGDQTVYEANLLTGSSPNEPALTQTGSFVIDAPDGLDSLVIDGHSVIASGVFAPVSFMTSLGNTLSITAFDGTNMSYSYTLLTDEHHPAVSGPNSLPETFSVVATDVDGDTANATLTINIVDDVPTAHDDGPYGVVEDGANLVSGNVLDNDTSGADAPKSFVAWNAAADAASIAELNSYGTLVQNGDGTWSYELDNGRAATQALTSASSLSYTLHYTMQDADGDTSPATLTITITGADDSATVVTAQAASPDATVYESGLDPNGSNAAADTETTTGSFTISATDGILNIVVGGTAFTFAEIQAFGTTNGVVNTGEGVLTLTGYSGDSFGGTVSFSYTLSATIDNDSIVQTGNDTVDGTGFNDSVALTVNGVGGTTASDDLVVRIVDDVPTANPDTDISTGLGAAGNVITGVGTTNSGADVLGADGASISGVQAGDNSTPITNNAGVGTGVLGLFGTLTLGADGEYTYVPNPNVSGTDVFSYTLTDGDGDTSVTTLTITIINGQPSLVAASETTSDAAGDDNIVNSNVDVFDAQTKTGSMSFDFGSDGANTTTPFSYTYDGGLGSVTESETTNGLGQKVITLTSASWVLTLNEVTGGYTFRQTHAYDHAAGTSSATGIVTVTLMDADGSTASKALTMSITDDTPTLGASAHAVIANESNLSVIGTMAVDGGADHPVTASLAGNVAPAGLTWNGNPIQYYIDLAHPDTLVAYTGTDHTQNNVFTLTVDAINGTYTFTEWQPLDAFSSVDVLGSTGIAGGPKDLLQLTSGAKGTGSNLSLLSGWHADAGFVLNDWKNGVTGATTTDHISFHDVNGSSQGFGVDSNNFDVGDILRFDFGAVTDYDGAGPYAPPNSSQANVTSITLSFTKTTTIDYVVHYTDGSISDGSFTSGKGNVIPPGGGTKFIDWVEIYSEGSAGKVTLDKETTVTTTGTKELSFDVTVTDHDSDSSSVTIGITVDGDHTLTGASGISNSIVGGTSADTLIGSTKDDTLTGNGGNDRFVLDGHSVSPGVGAGGHDTITDFVSLADGIFVDVASQNLTINTSTLISAGQITNSTVTGGTENDASAWSANASANKFFFNATTQELWYSANGTGSDKVDLAHVSTGIPVAQDVHTF